MAFFAPILRTPSFGPAAVSAFGDAVTVLVMVIRGAGCPLLPQAVAVAAMSNTAHAAVRLLMVPP
ncbi:hypothetical protein HEK131_27680 [Streptomyces seoulensis]|nr:hypothetical protein HEK131_27680 [Streptomyces seoulensis]